jgi:hypothetical protein
MITQLVTTEEELNCPINIIVRADRWGFDNEKWGIQIDNTITPLYCCNCHTQLPSFYQMQGSRYGQVGTVHCTCGADIHCTDGDNIVEYLDTMTNLGRNTVGNYHLDFVNMYKLHNDSFTAIRDKTGFNLFSQYAGQTVGLKSVLSELKTNYGLNGTLIKQHSFDQIIRLPQIVNEWLSVLGTINGKTTS